MHTVQQILNLKQVDSIYSIPPDQTVFEAVQMMAEKQVGALLVMAGEALRGIISERDYAREVILKGRSSRETLVGEIMSANVITVTPATPVRDALGLMSDKRIRHLPVVENSKVLGIISIGDLVKDVISDQQSTIEQLENYIRS